MEDTLSVQAFCIKYIVDENLVKSYLEHLKYLEMMNEKRKTETRGRNLQENSMSYEDFDWQKMVNEGPCKNNVFVSFTSTLKNITRLQ